MDLGYGSYRWQANVCLTLQEGFEAYLVGLFEDWNAFMENE